MPSFCISIRRDFFMSTNRIAWIETALVAACAMVLSVLTPDIWYLPSLGSFAVVLLSLRRGLFFGILSGLLWGLLHFPLGKIYFLSPLQVLIEYIAAFAVIGLVGIVYSAFQQQLKLHRPFHATLFACAGISVGIGIKYIFHYIAGFIFWADYAPEGMSPLWYSLVVNGTAGLTTYLFVLLVTVLFVYRYPRFFQPH